MKCRSIAVLVSLLFAVLTMLGAPAHASKGMNFQAVIKRPDGSLLNVSGLNVTLQILDPLNNCVLREEEHSGVNIANGYLNLVIGNALATTPAERNPSPILSLTQVFDNKTPRPGLKCVSITNTVVSSNQTYTPSVDHARKIRVRVTVSGEEIIGDFNVRSMAFAASSDTLEGKAADEFVQINSSQGVTQANVESVFSRYSALNDILNGTFSGAAASANTCTTATTATTATNVSGIVALANGGTGAATAAGARTNLGLGTLATMSPSGTASSSTYLRGDGTWATVTGGVSSVAGQTGAVTLSSTDLSDFATAVDTRADARADAKISSLVALAGTQTITGDKTFSGTNTYSGASSFTNAVTFSSPGPSAAVVIGGGGLVVSTGGFNNSGLGITNSGNITGSTAASGNLVLESTSNAAKGYILLGPVGGNVGIGTSAPSEKLEVSGTILTTGLKLVDGNQAASKVLTSDANGVASWQPAPSGGGGGSLTYQAVTSNLAVTSADNGKFLGVTGGRTITLPDATSVSPGFQLTIKQLDSSSVTVNASNSQTIDGSASLTLSKIYSLMAIVNTGNEWVIANRYVPTAAQLVASVASLTGFSAQNPTESTCQTLQITNNGQLASSVLSASTAGYFSTSGCTDTCTTHILPPGASCTIGARGTSAGAPLGAQTGSLTVTAAQGGSVAIALDGTVIAGGYSTSCADEKARYGTTTDGTITIDVDGNGPKAPFDIYCHNMATTPVEFITLVNTGGSYNYGRYTCGGFCTGPDVTSSYSKIRIDLSTMTVDVDDRTFATTTTPANSQVSSVSYGWARACRGNYDAAGSANIDLTGTPFAVADSVTFAAWWSALWGYTGAGGGAVSPDRKVVNMTGGGFCGGTSAVDTTTGAPGALVLKFSN